MLGKQMKTLFNTITLASLISLFSCSQLIAYEKMPSDRQLIAQAIKPFSKMGIGLGIAGLAYSGFLSYKMITTLDPKGRAVYEELRNSVFNTAAAIGVSGAALYELTKYLEK